MNLNIFSRTGGALREFLPSVTSEFHKFVNWITPLSNEYIDHDLETTKTDSILDREMLVSTYHHNDTVWVLFIKELNPVEHKLLLEIMRNGKFVIQNVKFEYQMWKKSGVILERFYDTFLTEKLLGMGYENERYGLDAIVKRYLDIDLPKDLQTSFVDNATITDAQLKYAVYDVLFLNKVKEVQYESILEHDKKFSKLIKDSKRPTRGLKKALWWTNEFIKVLSDMEYRGIRLNKDKWVALYHKALPLVESAEKKLNGIVWKDFYNRGVAAGFIYPSDSPVDKLFTSPDKKGKMLRLLYPDLDNTSMDQLRLYLKNNDPLWPKDIQSHNSKKANDYLNTFSNDKFIVIKYLLSGQNEKVFRFFAAYFKQEMIDEGLLIPANSVIINWASPVQRMQIFRWIVPALESTDKEHMEEVAYKHELLSTYLEEYQRVIGMVQKFGMNYIPFIQEDGRVHTHIDPVLNTGRISSSKPNVLNIINDNDYRAAFEAEEGYKFVMSDYNSEELVLTALMSKEQTWIDAIRAGHDLHSVNASRIFASDWAKKAEEDCQFAKDMSKCKCKGHKKLRDNTKTAGFGILYGISKFGLAWKIKDTTDAAQDIINSFYYTFPRIKQYFDRVGTFALTHLFTPEAGFGTARFVDKRKIHYDKNSIFRTAGNFTIQGLGVAILKVCTVLIRRHIKHMNHDAHIVLTPYDEIIMEVREDLAEYWQVKLKYYMELAGKLVLSTDLLTAGEPIIGDYWIH